MSLAADGGSLFRETNKLSHSPANSKLYHRLGGRSQCTCRTSTSYRKASSGILALMPQSSDLEAPGHSDSRATTKH